MYLKMHTVLVGKCTYFSGSRNKASCCEAPPGGHYSGKEESWQTAIIKKKELSVYFPVLFKNCHITVNL